MIHLSSETCVSINTNMLGVIVCTDKKETDKEEFHRMLEISKSKVFIQSEVDSYFAKTRAV